MADVVAVDVATEAGDGDVVDYYFAEQVVGTVADDAVDELAEVEHAAVGDVVVDLP